MMSKSNKTLSKPTGDNPLPDEHGMLLPVPEQKHRFTAEKVQKNKERYESIKRAIGCGVPVLTICEIFKVSHHIVGLISAREPDLVASGKKRLASKFRHGAHLALESAIDDIAEGRMPPSSKPVSAGIFTDKSIQLEGEATIVVEHRQAADPAELARQAREALARQVIEVEEVQPKSKENA